MQGSGGGSGNIAQYAQVGGSLIGMAGQLFGQKTEEKGAKQEAALLADLAARRRVEAAFTATQLESQASDALASGQKLAGEERRQAELAQSRIIALAAASGAGASDPTVVNLVARAAGEGAYRAGVRLYEGEAAARLKRMEGQATRYVGETEARSLQARAGTVQLAAKASGFQTAASLASQASTLFDKYGFGGPTKTTTTPATLGGGSIYQYADVHG